MQIMPRLFTKFRICSYNFLVIRYFKILDVISFLISCFTQPFGGNSAA